MKNTWLLKLINLWPPYLGAGVRVKGFSTDYTSVDVEMKLRFWNQNFVGTHFGGSLFSMTDPFLMLMLLQNLGRDYLVWDKTASIRFRRPAKGRVQASFRLSQDQIDSIRAQADQGLKVEPVFKIPILDDSGVVVAEVEKTLSIRRKDHKK